MIATQLPLRDVHLPPAPDWWPPALGWWLVLAVIAVLLAGYGLVRARRRRRQRRWAELFDRQMRDTPAGAAQLAAASGLLRRAARRVEPQAVLLQGEDWLRFLDGPQGTAFSTGDGRVLLEGGFRPTVDAALAARACALARRRFLQLMEQGR